MAIETKKKLKKGFACMTLEQRRRIASMGGKTAQALGVSHKWTKEEAARAGRIGGKISRRRKRVVQLV